MQCRPMFLAPVDIHGCISFNVIVITKIATNDSHLWSCVCCYQFLALCDKQLKTIFIFRGQSSLYSLNISETA